jgi:lambda repressor-like predicted transcriptional regulator
MEDLQYVGVYSSLTFHVASILASLHTVGALIRAFSVEAKTLPHNPKSNSVRFLRTFKK